MGGFPGFGAKIREGVGTLMAGMFVRDAERRARSLEEQLKRDALASEFAQTPGWTIIAGRYADYIAGMTDRQLDLGKHARKNAMEIERLSDAIDNANQLLVIASDAITRHRDTVEEHAEQNKRATQEPGTAATSDPTNKDE